MEDEHVINSKSDINSVLEKNLDNLAIYMQTDFCNLPCFTYEQSMALDECCKQIFHYLTDLKDAIKLLNN